MKESDPPVDWDLSSGSTFLNYVYPALPSAKFQLLCVRMIGQMIVHGMWISANFGTVIVFYCIILQSLLVQCRLSVRKLVWSEQRLIPTRILLIDK